MNKSARLISNIVYGIGVAIVLLLSCIALFGPNRITNPDAMIPLSWKEQAFIWLSFGTIPMLLACLEVYRFNEIKNSRHKKRNIVIIFLPGFICGACALFIIGLIITGMINSFF